MKKIKIGAITLDSPLIAAPLAGYSDLAFRLLCREYGAGLCYSEMISCHGLVRHQAGTLGMIRTVTAERPVIMQLFGAEPDIMAAAAAILSELPIDGIDINMGCPVKKVVKKGAGAALMREPDKAAVVIKAVVGATTLPVTVKIRSGWNRQTINAVDFAKMIADCGGAAVTIHPRTWSEGFSGRADHGVTAAVKAAVRIPVIGNGDITSFQEAEALMVATACDGVMIGRGCLGAPWVFASDPPPAYPNLARHWQAARRHLALIREYHSNQHPARICNQIGRYFKTVPGGAAIRKAIYRLTSLTELEDFLREFTAD